MNKHHRWIPAAAMAIAAMLVLMSCGAPTRAQTFVTANGDVVEIWCTNWTLHTRPVSTSAYGTGVPQEITNGNDPYCMQGATGNYIVNDGWFLGWYGHSYYTSSWFSRNPYPSVQPATYNVTNVHVYNPPPGTKVSPDKIVGGDTPSAAVKTAAVVKNTGTLPPPKASTRITSAVRPETNIPVAKTSPGGKLAPPDPKTQIPAAKAPPAPKPAAPKPAAPAYKPPSAPRPAAPAPRPAAPHR